MCAKEYKQASSWSYMHGVVGGVYKTLSFRMNEESCVSILYRRMGTSWPNKLTAQFTSIWNKQTLPQSRISKHHSIVNSAIHPLNNKSHERTNWNGGKSSGKYLLCLIHLLPSHVYKFISFHNTFQRSFTCLIFYLPPSPFKFNLLT
jgi:hypothetical protein